jgi:protease-4
MESDAPTNPGNTPPPLQAGPETPPPLLPPLIPQAPARPRKERKGRGWLIAACLFGLLLLAAGLLHFTHLFGFHTGSTKKARTAGRVYEESVVEDNDSNNKIAVLEVEGIIAGFDVDGGNQNLVNAIKDQLELAAEDKAVKAVLLKINSPGGEVLASDDIYRAIERFQKHTGKPVIASMGTLAASGGYYISAACRWIVAHELSITGSIGVIMHGYNYRGLMDKVGVQPMVFKSGQFKDMMSGDKRESEIQPEERKMMQDLVDETYRKFKKVIADGRGAAEARNRNSSEPGRTLVNGWETQYADGRILSGRQAFEFGFVDEIGSFEDAVERARNIAGIRDANLVRYQQPFDIANLFHLFGKAESRGIKVDIGVSLPRILPGRLYFIAEPFLH